MRYRNLASRGFVLPTRLQGSASSSYEAGSATGSRSRSWMPSASGPNTSATRNLGLIRRRARDAVANDPWAKTSVARWVSNVVGTGIQPYPKHPDPKVRRRLKAAWADWVGESDADERLDFYGQQALAARAMFVDGETLAILRPRLPSDGLTVPLQIQQLEGDHLPVDMSYPLANGNEIVNGVEFDRLNRRAAYHLYTQHPGEYGRTNQGGWETKRFDARRVVHAYQVLRPGQVRGVSDLATILLRLKTLDNFDDAVAFRQEVSNLFAGFIKKAPGDGGVDPVHTAGEYYDHDGSEILTLEPGSMQELGEGEDVQFSAPPGAPDNYMEFMRQQLMAAFASVGLPYEIASGDLRGISDRTLRVVVNEFHRLVQQYQWTTFIHQWCRPIWRSWIEAQVLAGTISARDFHAAKRHWMRVLWVPEGWAYFNPVQDVKAKTDEIRAGLISRSAVILAQGEDPETVLDEIAADNKAADDAGLTLDSDSRHGKKGAAAPPVDDDPADPAQK